MKLKRALMALVLLVAGIGLPASAQAGQPEVRISYVVTELPPGGSDGGANSINDRGWISGASTVAAGVTHATVWRHGTLADLGTLGGPNSAVLWPVKNNNGIITGVAETAAIDPRDEAWSCAAFFGVNTKHACVGFVWEQGAMRALPTFGGTNGFATGTNNRGHAVGWAEVEAADPSCNQVDQFLGFRAALWDTRHGDHIRQLPPLPGDSASAATAINDADQVVGISGDCSNAVGGFSARHAVMWENGVPTDIGNLGGVAWNTPMAINEDGLVVGFANAPEAVGDVFDYRPFAWTRKGGFRQLPIHPGDLRSQALGLNDDGLIVGLSRGPSGLRAVVWRDGMVSDLNDLAPGYDGHLLYAGDVNDDGVITGQAVNAAGVAVPFVATPNEP
jgi:probable HAF family extracellular repeat protein